MKKSILAILVLCLIGALSAANAAERGARKRLTKKRPVPTERATDRAARLPAYAMHCDTRLSDSIDRSEDAAQDDADSREKEADAIRKYRPGSEIND